MANGNRSLVHAFFIAVGAAAAALLPLGGCGADGGNQASMEEPPELRPPEGQRAVIEESDIYRRVGSVLYVQNAQTGLNLVSVSNPAHPTLLGRATATAGSAGELYVREGQAIVLLKGWTSRCKCVESQEPQGTGVLWPQNTEIVIVDASDKTRPQVSGRWCLPGDLVASRLVNNIIYVVTYFDKGGSRIYSLDISDPGNARVVARLQLPEASKEIFVSPQAIFVAGRASANYTDTIVQVITIADDGSMVPRGSVAVKGQPQGKFHMDLWQNQFRIVTYQTWPKASSRLTVLDVSDPDHLEVLGSLENIGSGEKLYATRFDGQLAYVVTFRKTDPLWIISLADPTRPFIVGQLQVPGWSDFLFPRGKRLIAVGRGPGGTYVGVSLFDVSDARHPRSLQQIWLGDPNSTSQATADYRAAALIESPDSPLLLAIPHTRMAWAGDCNLSDELELVEVTEFGLQQRGTVAQRGTIRRAFLVAAALYSLSDYELQAVSITDRDFPVVLDKVVLGSSIGHNEIADEYCNDWTSQQQQQQRHYQDYWYGHGEGRRVFCQLGESAVPPPASLIVLGLVYVALRLRGRRHRSS